MTASGEPLLEFLEVMRRLRAECAWKAGQTHRSLARYLLEETHETLEAIDTGDAAHLREELGDLLLQVYFHAVIAEETGEFTIDDVAADIIAKMRRRNPHVFAGRAPAARPAEINEAWEAIKAGEKQRDVRDRRAPADAARAAVRRQGARPAGPGRVARPDAAGDDLGDRLLALVAEAREAGVDPEQALRDAVVGGVTGVRTGVRWPMARLR